MRAKIQQIKTQLRRQQIQKQFQLKRNLLTYVGDSYYQIFKETIEEVQRNTRQGKLVQSRSGLDKLIAIIKQKSQASAYIFMHSENMSEIIELVAYRKIEHNQQIQILRQIELNDQVTNNLLQLLSIINYSILDQKSFKKVMRSFWQILKIDQISFQNLFKALVVVNRMMNPPNQIVYGCLQDNKISTKLAQIIEKLKTVQTDNKIIKQVLQTISLLSQNKQSFNQQPETHSKQNTLFLQFCMQQLNKISKQYLITTSFQQTSIEETLEINLTAIRYLLDFDEQLTKLIANQDLALFCKLMDSNVRKIQVNAVQIINILLVENSLYCDTLVGMLQFMELINKKLRNQLYYQDGETRNLMQKYTFILCNITNLRDNKLKMKISKQPVWQFALNNITRFNVLIEVFSFYFQVVPANQLLSNILLYLDAIAQLEIKFLMQNYKKAITITIHRLYHRINSQLKNQAMLKFQQKFSHRINLRYFLNDEMKDNLGIMEDSV